MVTDELQIASYNVNGLENKRKRLQIFTWLKEKKYSMICLQETLSVPAVEEWGEEWGGSVLFPHGLKNTGGMILFN